MYGGVKFTPANSSMGLSESTSREISNELWQFNLKTNRWSLVWPQRNQEQHLNLSETTITSDGSEEQPQSEQQQQSPPTASSHSQHFSKGYALPIAVCGHTMHLVGGNSSQSLLIFFGFSDYYGATLNIIQQFELSKPFKHQSLIDFCLFVYSLFILLIERPEWVSRLQSMAFKCAR
jgi:hypothetical protein